MTLPDRGAARLYPCMRSPDVNTHGKSYMVQASWARKRSFCARLHTRSTCERHLATQLRAASLFGHAATLDTRWPNAQALAASMALNAVKLDPSMKWEDLEPPASPPSPPAPTLAQLAAAVSNSLPSFPPDAPPSAPPAPTPAPPPNPPAASRKLLATQYGGAVANGMAWAAAATASARASGRPLPEEDVYMYGPDARALQDKWVFYYKCAAVLNWRPICRLIYG